MIPEDLKYTKAHEWIKSDNGTVTVGITDYAQDQLTEVVFVELPEVGRKVNVGDSAAVLESVKSVADVYAPVAGEVVEVNQALEDTPDRINSSPYQDGWIFRLKAESVEGDFMDAAAYQTFIES